MRQFIDSGLPHRTLLNTIELRKRKTSVKGLAGTLGLMGREPARQTSKDGLNPIWDTMVHLVCETFNGMRVV